MADITDDAAYERYADARRRLDEARTNWDKEVVNPARELLHTRLAEIGNADKENVYLEPLQYINEATGRTTAIIRFRLAFEILSPIIFGALAIASGIFVVVH